MYDSQLIRTCFNDDEYGDGLLMARIFKDEIIFDVNEQMWYIWHDNYWKPDVCNQVFNLASRGLAKIYREEANAQNGLGHKRTGADYEKRARALLSRKRSTNVIHFAEKQPDLMLENARWDADPWVLACKNGVVDLKTGEIRNAKQSDYIRTVIATEYKHLQERCPSFDQFLKDIFYEENQVKTIKTIKFIQRLLGYGITGLAVEHIFPVLYGRKGRNGKDTLLKVLEHALGNNTSRPIAGPVGQEILLSGTKSPNSATPYIYELRFKRMAWVSETNEHAKLDPGQVKLLTGGGTLTGRLLNQNPIAFDPQHLLMLVTNFKPRAPINDYALWNRLLLINFGISFVDNPTQPWQKKRDKELFYKLKEEKSGILSWLIRGAIDWNRYTLQIPDHIEETTQEYAREEDDFSEFVAMFEMDEGVPGMSAPDVYREYQSWWASVAGSKKPLGNISFHRRFQDSGFHRTRIGNGYFYKNLRLKKSEPDITKISSVQELLEMK